MNDPTSQGFEDTLKEWLHLADAALSADVTGESRRMITDQLAEIQRLLQKKQRQVEARIEGEIETEDAEIARIQESLHGVGRGQAEQTEAYDMLPVWYNLKTLEWQGAYDALTTDTRYTVKTILERLIAILKVTFDRCRDEVKRQHDELEFAALYPGETIQEREYKLPKRRDKELYDHCTNCQVKTLQYCLPNIKQVLVRSIIEDRKHEKLFSATTERIQEAYTHYVDACVEFSWVACLEEEPVQLVTNPRKECKPLLSQFHGESEVPRKSYVEWPAIVQNDVIRAVWQLFHRDQPIVKTTIVTHAQQSDVAMARLSDRGERAKVPRAKNPRAVVFEDDDLYTSRGSVSTRSLGYESTKSYGSMSSNSSGSLSTRSTKLMTVSSSSISSQQSRTSHQSDVKYGHVHTGDAKHRPPTIFQDGKTSAESLPNSATGNLRQSSEASLAVSISTAQSKQNKHRSVFPKPRGKKLSKSDHNLNF